MKDTLHDRMHTYVLIAQNMTLYVIICLHQLINARSLRIRMRGEPWISIHLELLLKHSINSDRLMLR